MTRSLPPHPGSVILHDCLEPLSLTVTRAAKDLGVSRQTLNNILLGKSALSPEMAVRLEKAFGGTAEAWMALQIDYEIAKVRCNATNICVKRYWQPN